LLLKAVVVVRAAPHQHIPGRLLIMGGSLAAVAAPAPASASLITTSTASGRASGRYTHTRSLEADYVVETKVVGSGLSGPVRLATSRRDGQQVAIKSLKKRGLSAKRLAELKNEAEVYLSLDHPHVARLERIYETPEEAQLVMEYMEGGELYDRLAERTLYTEAAAAEATHQMLLAVAYLHGQGIAHRDLKLENFLYERRDTDHLKIIDFGFAKCMDHHTKMSQACGSIHYVAPEVLEHAYTEQADLWSLGVIAFMLLMGAPPFSGSDDEVLRKIRKAEVHWSSRAQKVSGPARDFLQQLLTADPKRRPSANLALEHEWLRCRSKCDQLVIDDGILNNLKLFARASQFKRSVLYMMVWSTSTEDRMQLRRHFLAIDHNNSGTISLTEFRAVLGRHLSLEAGEVELLFRSLDIGHNDEIEYSEFLAAAMQGQLQVHEGMLRTTFARFDGNGDGLIDREELACILGGTFSTAELEELIQEADTSGDGKLDYEEFLAYLRRPEEAGARQEKRRTTEEKLSMVIDSMRSAESMQSCFEDEADLAMGKKTSRLPAFPEPPPLCSFQKLPTLLRRAGRALV